MGKVWLFVQIGSQHTLWYSLFLKVFVVLHSAVHIKSDESSFVRMETDLIQVHAHSSIHLAGSWARLSQISKNFVCSTNYGVLQAFR